MVNFEQIREHEPFIAITSHTVDFDKEGQPVKHYEPHIFMFHKDQVDLVRQVYKLKFHEAIGYKPECDDEIPLERLFFHDYDMKATQVERLAKWNEFKKKVEYIVKDMNMAI